jgi:phosphoenolpyruvate-protein kinase (PTS system EI component)
MVEIPAAAIMADHLAVEVDFFSIGTNDLSQYTFAADRTNATVSPLANAMSPAVLRLIQSVITAAHARGKWVGLCGELAGEPLAIPILLGLGLDEFSMNAPAIPLAKEILRAMSRDEAREIAGVALTLPTPEAIQDLVQQRVPAALVV